jgi:cytochrome c oxidase subunit 1
VLRPGLPVPVRDRGPDGLFLGTLATDVHLHDTYFVVSHFHYTMFGSVFIAFMGGLYHWWPKIFGRMYSETWGRIGCFLTFVGFNLTFFPQFVMGARGMPGATSTTSRSSPPITSCRRSGRSCSGSR